MEARNTSDKGTGLFATRDLSAEDTLISVPYSMLMSPQSAQQSTIAKILQDEGLPDCETGSLEVCFLLPVIVQQAHIDSERSSVPN